MEKRPDRIDNKYKVVKSLGKGSFGEVFLCREGKKYFAVKVLNHLRKKDPAKAIQSFKKEFLTLTKLNHPNLAQPVSFGFDGRLQRYFLITNYIRGKNIVEASKHLSIEEIEKLFVQILQALHYLHTSGYGFRHNDIKPSNILVAETDSNKKKIKLIDFGAISYAPLRVTGGTVAYVAPEQIISNFPELGNKSLNTKPGPQSDLYSLGVVWYLCLTGVNPFLDDKDQKSALLRHLQYDPPPPSSFRPAIPPYLNTIILKMLRKNPDDRYESAAEIIHDLKFLTNKKYFVVPSSTRRYYFSDNEWIEQTDAWQALKRKWNNLSKADSAKPCIVQITDPGNQAKKVLEHFKDYVQTHEGHYLSHSLPNNFRTPSAIVVADFSSLENIFQRIDYALRWNKNASIPWLILFTGEKEVASKNSSLDSTVLHLKNFTLAETERLLSKLFHHKHASMPQRFLGNLHRLTHGNPIGIISVLKTLAKKGIFLDDMGRWHPALFEDLEIDFDRLSQHRRLTQPKKQKPKKEAGKYASIQTKNEIARDLLSEGKLELALAIYKETRGQGNREITNNDLGYAYLLLHKSDLAQKTLEEDLDRFERLDDKTALMRTHYLLGETMRKLKRDYPKAIKHYYTCEKLSRDLKDKNRLMRAYYGLATTYLDYAHSGEQTNALDQALRYFKKSLELILRLQADPGKLDTETAAIHLCIGLVYEELGQKQKAIDIYQTITSALEAKAKKSHAEMTRLAESYLAIADLHVNQHAWQKAGAFLNKTLKLAHGISSLKEIVFGVYLLQAKRFLGMKKESAATQNLKRADHFMKVHQIKPNPLAQKYLNELAHLKLNR